ncbi:diguanylate cyclase [Crateriforma conspicua]|uniref:diguanylate cyclase n=1 Tax=Crateriforma conspicua TaxID=2527996 RepID=UPI0011884E2C|nr:diguanylate cyclase [Crateriforma conspicua]QDV62962.1 Diguanylate cyclase DosC [Crateriforma conspicua]
MKLFRTYFAALRIAFALTCVSVGLLISAQMFGVVPDVDHERTKAKQSYCESVAIHAAMAVRRGQWSDLDGTLKTLVDRNPELLSVGVRSDLGILRLDTGYHESFWAADSGRNDSTPQDSTTDDSSLPIQTAGSMSSMMSPAASTPDQPVDSGLLSTAKNRIRQTATEMWDDLIGLPGKLASLPEEIRQSLRDTGDESAAVNTNTVEVPITLNRRPWGTVEFSFQGDQASLWGSLTSRSLFPLTLYVGFAGLFAYFTVMAKIMGAFTGSQVVPDRVRGALDTLAEGLLLLDDKGHIVLANQAFLSCTGSVASEVRDRKIDELPWVHDADSNEDQHPWLRSIQSSESITTSIQRYRISSGEVRVFSVNTAPIGGDNSKRGALVTLRDVTHIEAHRAEQERMLSMLRSSRDEIRRKNRELELLATRDSLTNCLNRRAFFERFETLYSTATSNGTTLACLMFDNDHFKSVNDNYGHHIGDEVLRKVSKTIRDRHESRHLVCRYGGEEFCVVMPGCDLQHAIHEAEETRRAIMEIRLDDPAELRLTASIGVSELVNDPADPQELINQADACLYIAKQRGRNRVVAYEPGFEEQQESAKADDSRAAPSTAASVNGPAVPFQAVTALLGALSYRDSQTAEHSCRVADLCVRTARGLVDQKQLYMFEVAGLLHDIGKIGVPDHVLLKPGKLTAAEWKLMGEHDRIGVDIIEGTFDSPMLTEIIHSHHAFYAGGGRHDDLPHGKDIPLGARILTIADSYDAMVSDRVYRKGRSHEEAVEELRRCSGTQFDPDLVERFIEKIHPSELGQGLDENGLTKQAALKIGMHVELIADAMDHRDVNRLRELAVTLSGLAKSHQIDAIAHCAQSIETRAVESLERVKTAETATGISAFEIMDPEQEEENDWMQLLCEANNLLDLCRATQNVYLGDTTERNRQIIENFLTDVDA